MRPTKSHMAVIALLYLVAGVIDPWVGLSMILLHLALWMVVRAISRRHHRSHEQDLKLDSDRLLSAVREHQMYKVEGEIFGLTARLQEAVREAVKDLDSQEQRSIPLHVRVIPIILTFLGLQTLMTLSIIAQATMRIDLWAIVLVIVIPFMTYQFSQEHVIGDGRGA